MTRTVPSDAAPLPPLDLTPEQAAAIAVALAAQPDGPYAAAGRAALDKVLAALEPDPRRREALVEGTRRVRAEAARVGVRAALQHGLRDAPPAGGHPTHPAGRALRRPPAARPHLVVLTGGRDQP